MLVGRDITDSHSPQRCVLFSYVEWLLAFCCPLRPVSCLCRTNFQLSQDPDEDMQIVKDAVGYVRDTITDLKKQKSDVDWTFYTTGHSLGGFLATAVAVGLDPEITKCASSLPKT